MKVPFWTPAKTYFSLEKEIDRAIKRILSKGELILGFGEDIYQFEKSFADFVEAKHAIMVGAGTHALYLSYRALGITYGDEVITTSHTFIATIDQIVALGAKPVLVDIGDDGLIDPALVASAITKRTKAIVPVHLEGNVCQGIKEVAQDHDLLVIEDAAQAIGGIGVGYGKATCYSLFPAKILGSVGNAGIITTNDDDLAERLELMRSNWNIGKNFDVDKAEFGMNMEPDNLQAAVLNVKIKHLQEYLDRREEIANIYRKELSESPIILPDFNRLRVWQDFVIRVPQWRSKLINELQDKNIGILGHDLMPNHWYPTLRLQKSLPKTENYIGQQIRIPCNPDLTDEQVYYVAKVIRKFYEK